MTELQDNWVKEQALAILSRKLMPDQVFEQLREQVGRDVNEANEHVPKIFPPLSFQYLPGLDDPDSSFVVRRIRNKNIQDKQMLAVRFWKEPGRIMIEFENHQVDGSSTLEVEVDLDPHSETPRVYVDETPREISEISRKALAGLFGLERNV